MFSAQLAQRGGSPPRLPDVISKRLRECSFRQRPGNDIPAKDRMQLLQPRLFEAVQAVQYDEAANEGLGEGLWELVLESIDCVVQALEEAVEQAPSLVDPLRSRKREIVSPQFTIAANSVVFVCTRLRGVTSPHIRTAYSQIVEDFLVTTVLPRVRAGATAAQRLRLYKDWWEQHKIFSEFTRRFFMVHDKHVFKDTGDLSLSQPDSLSAAAIRGWHNWLFDRRDVKDEFMRSFMDIVNLHRDSDAEDPESLSLLREVVEIFVSMGLVEQTEFKRIKCFVSSSLLTRGRFEVPVQVPLLEYLYQSDEDSTQPCCIDSTASLQCYKRVEDKFLEVSREYLMNWRREWGSDTTLAEYARHVDRFIRSEQRRVKAYLVETTWPRLINCIVEELLVAAQREPHCLVNLGGEGHTAQDLMHSDRRKDLRVVFLHLLRVEEWSQARRGKPESPDFVKDDVPNENIGLEPLVNSFAAFCISLSKEAANKYLSVVARPQNANAGLRVSQSVVNSAAAAMHLVLALGEILARLRDMAATDFAERPSRFRRSIEAAMARVVNRKELQLHSGLAHCLDSILRGTVQSPTDIGEMDVSKRMELGSRTIAIFEFLHDKDMFQQVYTILLQQRLLESREVYNVAANLELEHKFLHLLLEVQDITFTKGMQNMIDDITSDSSKELQRDFTKFLGNLPKQSVEQLPRSSQVLVLTKTSWPQAAVNTPLRNPPTALRDLSSSFLNFYKTHHAHREVMCHWNDTCVVLQATFPKQPSCEFHVTAVQATLLNVFRKKKKVVSLHDIARQFDFAFDEHARDIVDVDEKALVDAVLDTFTNKAKAPSNCKGQALILISTAKVDKAKDSCSETLYVAERVPHHLSCASSG
eukprot:INCI7636.10.p1 GENE.INCI7636.10~~INCI7636.10.p1  ORF type:complete len:868 (+),score=138.81 INCI7636.10:128-2731(+)